MKLVSYLKSGEIQLGAIVNEGLYNLQSVNENLPKNIIDFFQSSNDLIQQTENVQSGRQIRFTNAQQIMELKPILKAYIFEAIEVEKLGLKIDFKKSTDLTYPEEFQKKLDENSAFKTAFEALTPGRQRAYNLYFSVPKQSATRVTRIEKYTQRILDRKGINDCTCGLSKKMPACDGSHKAIR